MPFKKHFGKVESGRFVPDDPELYALALTPFEGKRASVTVEPIRKNRSDKENRYYWGVVVNLISKELGYFPDETHHALRFKFLRTSGGEQGTLETAKSTTELSTKEFEDYLEHIRIWAGAFLGIYIPKPNEVTA
jgi:hypothetical protein